MMQIVALGMAAGAASALLFASVASGSLISVALFYAAPLPIMIAALGWSHLAGLIAAIVAALALALTLDSFFLLTFLAAVGLPAWWLSYLYLLGRPDADGTLEWYPKGRIILWAAVIGAGIVMLAVPQLGTDLETFRTTLRAAFERVLRAQSGIGADQPIVLPGVTDPKLVLDVLVTAMPPTAAVLSMATNLANLWIAQRVTAASGRLKRQPAPFADLRFPPLASLLLLGAMLLAFLPGLLGLAGSVLSATLFMAFMVLGFATLHGLTMGSSSRGLVLTSIYMAVVVFGWTALIVCLLGLVDHLFDLRGRYGARGAGPSGGSPGPPLA
jgi:hypothetical protein